MDEDELARTFERLREEEYGYLDEHRQVYLDHTGAGLPSRGQIRAHAERLAARPFGNPHSESPTSLASTRLVERTRAAVLRHFNADPGEYAAVFTPNATGACRLVGEAYPFRRGDRLVLTADNHNSVNGIREFARARGARVVYAPLRQPELRTEGAALHAALGRGRGLLAYPAQSNFTGVRNPLTWVGLAQRRGYDVLLDAAAFAPANRLDLSAVRPEFVAVSWYKVFGYPTGVGCLVARRDALARLRRPWFAGGTIHAVSALGGWHVPAGDESAFEDGTLNFLAVPDVEVGLELIGRLGIGEVHRWVTLLTGLLLERLRGLRHADGAPLVLLYGPRGTGGRGGTVAFNVLDRRGRVVDERIVARDAAAAGISLRTGCFCNPGAGEGAFALTRRMLRGAAGRGVASLDDYLAVLGLPSGGAVRASVGLSTNRADVESLARFLAGTYGDREPDRSGLVPRERC